MAQVLNTGKKLSSSKIPAGTILILQGTVQKAMNILHSGMAELLSCKEDTTGKSPDEIMDASDRIGLIRGESVYGILGIRDEGPYSTSIRAITDCIVSVNPVEQKNLLVTLQSNISFNLKVLRALNQRIESAIYLFNNYKYLRHKFASIADSLALAGDHDIHLDTIDNASREKSGLVQYSAYLKQLAAAKNSTLPIFWDCNVFLGRLQQELELYRDYDGQTIESLLDYPQVLFVKRLIQKDDAVLIPLFKGDEPMNFYVFQFMGDILEEMLAHNARIVREINMLAKKLFSSGGWIAKTLDRQKPKTERIAQFNHYLEKFCWRCRQDTMKLLGIDLQANYPIYADLVRFRNTQIDIGTEIGEPATSGRGLKDKYRDLLAKLLDFGDMNSEFRSKFRANIKKFRETADKKAAGTELAKLRQVLSRQYWELYKKCFLKVIDTDLKGFIPGIMLHFGLVDETLVSDKIIAQIDEAYSKNLCSDMTIPVMTLPYFLEKIYRSDINPSITEMGESFRKVLARQENLRKSQKETAILYENTAEDRVRFEIDTIASETAKLLYGNRSKAVPFLYEDAFTGEPSRLFLEPDAFHAQISSLRERDYSVFYREVILRHKYGTDFIKKEIPPIFVLYPCVGTRYLLWQELDGVKKDTPGRIFFPAFFMGRTEDAIPLVFAQFRWELQKTISGVKWTDPVEGGLVGTYYDYINFYKKNPRLSTQAKEDLKEFIQKTRSDRERFSQDYLVWLNYEYEGRLRMNPAVREIFYRFCPFPAPVRKEMAAKPLFTDLETKYRNRIKKEILKIETRKKRFEGAGAEIPEDLLAYRNFLDA